MLMLHNAAQVALVLIIAALLWSLVILGETHPRTVHYVKEAALAGGFLYTLASILIR